MWRGHIKLILFIALPISVLILISVLYAPNYLNYADPPTKADAVVLFIENTHIEVLEAKRIISALTQAAKL